MSTEPAQWSVLASTPAARNNSHHAVECWASVILLVLIAVIVTVTLVILLGPTGAPN